MGEATETTRVDGEPPPRWRTLDAEAARRGMPPRALRDLCNRYGIDLRGRGKYQAVAVADLDAAFDRMPVSGKDDAGLDDAGPIAAPAADGPRNRVDDLVHRTVHGGR